MVVVRARVRAGRLVVDEPTDLPEGTEIELVGALSDADDDLDVEDRAQLEGALAGAAADVAAGRTLDGDALLGRLRSGR